jgi:hypothetical protein
MRGTEITVGSKQGKFSASMRNNFTAHDQLPLFTWFVLFFVILASTVYDTLFGYNISGLSWVLPMVAGAYVIATRIGKVTFPWKVWIPLILLLIVHLFTLDYALLDFRVNPLQRTFQLFSPLVVGIAISTYRPAQKSVKQFIKILRIFTYILSGFILYIGRNWFWHNHFYGFAAPNMAVLFMSIFYANRYLMYNEKRDVLLWLILAFIPVLSITRILIVCTVLTFPFSFTPMPFMRRAIFIIFMLAGGLLVFQLPAIQDKMFFSGHGQLSDVGNDNFETSGREFMLELMLPEANTQPWFGHGTGSAETMSWSIANLAFPHDDWLLTYFDYGITGIVILLSCILLTIWYGLKAKNSTRIKEIRLLFLTGTYAFIPFMIIMFTDNILVYAPFFGMIHYLILGFGYAALQAERDARKRVFR